MHLRGTTRRYGVVRWLQNALSASCSSVSCLLNSRVSASQGQQIEMHR